MDSKNKGVVLIWNKQAKTVVLTSLLFFFLVFIFVMYSVLAEHVIRTSAGGTSINILEDTQFFLNISVNNSDAGQAANITQVNITLDTGFVVVVSTNGTDSVGEFSATATVLSWSNTTGYLVNGSEIKYFWINISATTPGNYNLTVLTVNASGSGVFSSNISVVVNDTTAPSSVNITAPVSYGNYSGASVLLNASVSDNGVMSAVYYNVTNSSNTQVLFVMSSNLGNSWNATLNTTAYADGLYNITVYANDTLNNLNNTAMVSNIRVDNSVPWSVEFGTGTETSGTNVTRTNLVINVTASDNGVGLANITINLYNSTGLVNSTTTTSSPNYVNITGLADEIYYFNATARDLLNSANSSVTRNVRIDTTAPAVTITAPVTYGNYSGAAVLLNATVTDAGVAVISAASFNVTNSTGAQVVFTSGSQVGSSWNATLNTTAYADGLYNITVYANDTLNNLNNTAMVSNIRVDNSVPWSVEFGTGTETSGTNVTRTNLVINVTASDNGVGLANITINLYNSTGLVNSTTTTSSPNYVNITGLADEIYYFNATARDLLNSANSSTTRNVRIDTTAPVVTLIDPAASASATTTAYNFTFNVTDVVVVGSCSLIFDGSIANRLTSVNGSGATSGMYNSSLSVATHTWNVNCTDAAGNVGNSSTRTLTVTNATTTTTDTSSGGTTTLPYWTNTILYTDKELSLKGIVSKPLAIKERVGVRVEGTTHYIGVTGLTSTQATINVSSTPQTATLTIGQTKKFEVTNDTYYDIKVTLNSINSSKANLSIEYVHEAISAAALPGGTPSAVTNETNATGGGVAGNQTAVDGEEEQESKGWIIIVSILAGVIIISVGIVWFILRAKRR